MKQPIALGLTIGDTGGIGPEIAVKAAAAAPKNLNLVLIGYATLIQQECRGAKLPKPPLWNPADGRPSHRLQIWEPAGTRAHTPKPGSVHAPASRAAVHWIRHATEQALAGTIDGIVTAPICKEGLMRAKLDYPGHTEMLAEFAGGCDVEMMLIGGPLRVTLATRHIPINQVERSLSKKNIQRAVTYTAQALRWMNASPKRIAVCGLNPHAGDGGAIGDAEIKLIEPALNSLPDLGVEVVGPVPADTIFHYARKREYGAVVAMYHDQGLAPLKMLAFETGVNVTLGLPFVRTSPDHGTAFDIAGKGVANATSMLEAIRTAHKLCKRPNPWGSV